MTSPSLSVAWLQLLALLAVEVSLIALVVALLRRWSPSAAWSRTFCQAGIIAMLVVTACELSGSARCAIGWAASTLTRRGGEGTPAPAKATPLTHRGAVGQASRLPARIRGGAALMAGKTPAPLHSPPRS